MLYPDNPPLYIIRKAVYHGLALIGGNFILRKLLMEAPISVKLISVSPRKH
jgi:hypothetical protein